MSIDSEDFPLEEALRADLPTDETAARLRRRLLAAGVAVGNGMAATTAAAAGTAPGLVAGAAAKVGAVSWGMKLGLAAAVAIPTVGLLSEHARQEPAAVVSSVRAPAPAESPAPQTQAEPAASAQPSPTPPALEPRVEPLRASGTRVSAHAALTPDETAPAEPGRRSQVLFEGGEPPAASKTQSTLAEETRLLDAAFAQLSAGNQARAAELVREHEARFPKGLLVRERERAKARLHEISRGD